MDIPETVTVVWKLKETMDAHGVTRYAVQKEAKIAMNTLRGMYDGTTRRPDLDVLGSIIGALRRMTGQPITLTDVLTLEIGE
ncbi:helix-turn-helix transcriptional regulator [Deinococcus sp. Leaf326]|uniref:helix-turn-helix domain-containing protein n=1 Tax=Deinococcus sp. Leaf326 TaxID=1736338 RepID=UPI00138F0F8E|nr:helix-turn-helix transcriptional regulator [Deinococcus sp. Leaf326]